MIIFLAAQALEIPVSRYLIICRCRDGALNAELSITEERLETSSHIKAFPDLPPCSTEGEGSSKKLSCKQFGSIKQNTGGPSRLRRVAPTRPWKGPGALAFLQNRASDRHRCGTGGAAPPLPDPGVSPGRPHHAGTVMHLLPELDAASAP